MVNTLNANITKNYIIVLIAAVPVFVSIRRIAVVVLIAEAAIFVSMKRTAIIVLIAGAAIFVSIRRFAVTALIAVVLKRDLRVEDSVFYAQRSVYRDNVCVQA